MAFFLIIRHLQEIFSGLNIVSLTLLTQEMYFLKYVSDTGQHEGGFTLLSPNFCKSNSSFRKPTRLLNSGLIM